MKVLVTGAHFTPALAVIEEFKKNGVDVLYVGRRTTMEDFKGDSVESQVLPKLGIKYLAITTGRLQRSFSIHTIPSLLKIPIGITQTFLIFLHQKPDVILSFGGYVAVPVVFVGWLFSIPIIVHEQTLVSGLANKISSFFADKIALSFSTSPGGKKVLTGNPLRKEIIQPVKKIPEEYYKIFSEAKKEKLPVILVTGGNQGSHVINEAVEDCLNKVLKISYIIHQTGDSSFGDFERLEKLQNEKYLVKKWIGEEIGAIMKKVDLVISRAGVNTLSELAFFGTPALVIPLQPLYQDEQVKNAKYFQKLGLVRILPQSKLSEATLFKELKSCLNDLDNLKKNAKPAKRFVIPDAAKRLALETILLGK